MSMCYWLNEGIGIRSSSIYPYLDKHKCFEAVSKQLPDEKIEEDNFDIDSFLYGNPFEHLGDFMYCLDDSDTFIYESGEDGESYCLYPPSYPWDRKWNEPDSITEVHKRLVKIILQITNLTEQQAESLIDDNIYEVGCG